MVFVTLILLSLTLAACSSGDTGQPEGQPEGQPDTNGEETTSGMEGPPSEATGPDEESPGEPDVEQLASEAPGQGPKRPRLFLASSASVLSRAMGARIPDAGEGTYLAALWGEKPTGGYSVKIQSVRVEGDRATIRIALNKPPPDAMVTQALTYPYATAVARGESLGGKEILLKDQKGRRLDWLARDVGPGG